MQCLIVLSCLFNLHLVISACNFPVCKFVLLPPGWHLLAAKHIIQTGADIARTVSGVSLPIWRTFSKGQVRVMLVAGSETRTVPTGLNNIRTPNLPHFASYWQQMSTADCAHRTTQHSKSKSNGTATWCNTAGFISAGSLYMFRAQAPIIRSI